MSTHTHRGCRVDDGKLRGERDRESSFPGVFFFCFSTSKTPSIIQFVTYPQQRDSQTISCRMARFLLFVPEGGYLFPSFPFDVPTHRRVKLSTTR